MNRDLPVWYGPRTSGRHEDHRGPEGGIPHAEVGSQEKQGVADHEIVDGGCLRPALGVLDQGTTHEADLPSGARGTDAEVRLLAVGEVPLVEKAHVRHAFPAERHEGPVRVVGDLPAFRYTGRLANGTQEGLDPRHLTVTHVGACQAG